MKPITLKELASQLNLSISTVSKALNDSYEVNEETKNRVMQLANALHYQPNPYARSLRKQDSRTIAVIIPEIANNFFTLAINGIELIARQLDYHVLIYLSHEDFQKEVEFTKLLQNGRVDGVILSISANCVSGEHLVDLHKKNIPIVFFDRVFEGFEAAKVTTDDYESGNKAVRHLIEKGCRRIAHLAISDHLSIGRRRKQGYIDALRDNAMEIDERLIVEGTDSNELNYQKVHSLLDQSNRPDGIFAAVEKLAVNCYEACHELDIKIGSELKLISFSNLETAEFLSPSLTTITQPAFDIGKTAATLLFNAIRKKDVSQSRVVLHSVLIERASTA